MIVPVYAGGYLWHNNLATCGYAVLVGVGLAHFADSLSLPLIRRLYVIGLFAVFIGFGMSNVSETIHSGIHATAFRINNTTLFRSPPVPAGALKPHSLIYIEDRLQLGKWNYGAGNLFKLVYLNSTVEELIVPQLDLVSPELCVQWLQQPSAFFVRYDDRFAWHDASNAFRTYALSQVTVYTNRLFSDNRGKEVADIIAPLMPKLVDNGIAHYHYALSLQLQGRQEAALSEYAEALRLMPRLFFGFYNRGYFYAGLGRGREACEDFRHAKSIDPNYPSISGLLEKWCH